MGRIICIKYDKHVIRMGLFDSLFCMFINETCKFAKTVSEEVKWLDLKVVRKFYETVKSENVYHVFPKNDTLNNDEWSKQEWVFPLEKTDDTVTKEIKVRLYKTETGSYMLMIGVADNTQPADTGYMSIFSQEVDMLPPAEE